MREEETRGSEKMGCTIVRWREAVAEKKDLTCAFLSLSLVLMVQYLYCMSLFHVIFLKHESSVRILVS